MNLGDISKGQHVHYKISIIIDINGFHYRKKHDELRSNIDLKTSNAEDYEKEVVRAAANGTFSVLDEQIPKVRRAVVISAYNAILGLFNGLNHDNIPHHQRRVSRSRFNHSLRVIENNRRTSIVPFSSNRNRSTR
jgi:hypothetical protein